MALTFLLALGVLAVLGTLSMTGAWLWPKRALPVVYFLILVAGTKFRTRDPNAAISGQIDWAVLLELGLFAVALVAVLVIVWVRRPRIGRPGIFETMLGLYVLFALTSVLWSPVPELTLTRAAQLAIVFVVATVSTRVLGPGGTLRGLMVAMVVYVVVAAGLGATLPFSWAKNLFLEGGHTEHQFGWFAMHPIACGTWAGIGFALVLSGLTLASRDWRERILRLPLWVWLIPLAAVMVATRARGPNLALMAACGMILARRWAGPYVMTGLFTVGLAGVIAMFGYGDRIADLIAWAIRQHMPVVSYFARGETSTYILSLSGRVQLWHVVLSLFSERPITGYGFMASREILAARVPWAGYAHNALGQTLLDFGLIGVALLWVPLMVVLVTALVRPRWRPVPALDVHGVAFGVLMFQVINGVSSESFSAAPSFEILVVMCAILGYERTRRARRA